jgi:hypothetical protein
MNYLIFRVEVASVMEMKEHYHVTYHKQSRKVNAFIVTVSVEVTFIIVNEVSLYLILLLHRVQN